MKISTEIGSAARIVGEERAIACIAEAGFDAWDFSMFNMCRYDWGTRRVVETDHPLSGKKYLEFARRLKRAGSDCGIVCNQSHAPFPTFSPEMLPYLERALECTAEAGGQICVIHPANDRSAEENAEMYFKLLPVARACGVKIATENMYNWDQKKDESSFAACATPADFCAHLDAVHDEGFVACLDVGHAEMRGSGTSAPEMVRALGDRLQALHLHDNNRWHDSHQIPFSMEIDFGAIVDALREIRYGGYFTLESDQFLRDYTEETVSEGVQKLAEAAKRLAGMFDRA